MFHDDHEDGSLEVIATGPLPLESVAAAKSLAHWLSVGVPLPAARAAAGPDAQPGARRLWTARADAARRTRPRSASLSGHRRGADAGNAARRAAAALIVLPLFVPILIFGVAAIEAVVTGPGSFTAPFSILCALTLASCVLAPLATAAALRLNL